MNETKGRVLLLCLIGIFIVIILGWKHTDSLSAKTDQEDEPIGVVEISLVTISPQRQNKYNRQEEYTNFDLRHLAIVGKDEPSDAGQHTERDTEVPEVDGEADGTDGTGSEVDSDVMQTASGDDVEYEDDASGDSGGYAEDGVRDRDDGIDTSDDTIVEGSVDESYDEEDGYNDIGFIDEQPDGDSGVDEQGQSYTEQWSSNSSESTEWNEYSNSTEEIGSRGFADESDIRYTDNESLTYLGNWTATAYCACPICTGAYSSGYTASGTLVTEGRTIACNSLPFGTQVYIDGYGYYIVEDTGWSPYGDAWLDFFFDSHDSALAFGLRQVEVYLVN